MPWLIFLSKPTTECIFRGKNKFLGGEGLFNTVVTGPGKIVVQTMPISAVANSLARFFPQGK